LELVRGRARRGSQRDGGRSVLHGIRGRLAAPSISAGQEISMASGVGDRTVIAGIGQTEFSKNSGRSELQLAAEASLAALNDAGLTVADVDGMVTYTLDSTGEFELIRNLGIKELR